MSIKAPTNMLYANTVSRRPYMQKSAKVRKARSRTANRRRKIGIFDINARAGLLFDTLDFLSRRQSTYTFYPVEALLPMGLGKISPALLNAYAETDEERSEIEENILVDDFFPILRETRENVEVDHLIALVRQPLATEERYNDSTSLLWNYFAIGPGTGTEVIVSVADVREFAKEANRPFEAAVTMMALAAVWSGEFRIGYHKEARSCPFDFNEDRHSLVKSIKKMKLCAECTDAIPADHLPDLEVCLSLLKEYER